MDWKEYIKDNSQAITDRNRCIKGIRLIKQSPEANQIIADSK